MGELKIKKQDIIAILVLIVLVKTAWYCFSIADPRIKEIAYGTITDRLITTSVLDMQSADKQNSNENLYYYIGRGNCPDCRDAINNIMSLSELIRAKYGSDLEYVKLQNKINDAEREYLDSIEVDNIPTIVVINHKGAYRFEYEQIISENYITEFKKFVEKETGKQPL